MATPSSTEGEVGFGVQSGKGTAATAFKMIKMTRFTWTPDVQGDEEGEPEIGGDMDVSAAQRYGHNGATFSGELRFRPGNAGMILRAFGMTPDDGEFIIFPGVNDTIRVTDAGGGPVDVNILTGTGHTASPFVPYTGAAFCPHLKAVLDGNATLSGTYTITYGSKKFTIAVGSGSLSLHWSHANCTMAELLGFSTSADDTGSLSYTGDNEVDMALRHVFTPITAGSSFPYVTILDKMDQASTLNTVLVDARVNSFTINAEDKNVIRLTFEGRALTFRNAVGSETETADTSELTEPNTGSGAIYFPTASYKMARLSGEFRWQETVVPALTQPGPEEVIPGRRSASGNADVYLGSEASAGLFKKTYYGGTGGTTFSTTMTQQRLHAKFLAGQTITLTGTTTVDYYGMILHAEECRLLTYPLEKSGDDPIKGGLTFQIHKGSTGWCIVLINDYATGYYD